MTEAEWLVKPDTIKLKNRAGLLLSKRKCLLAVCAYGLQVADSSTVPPLGAYLKNWEAKADAIPLAPFTLDEMYQQMAALVEGHAINTPPQAICAALGYMIQTSVDRGIIGPVMMAGVCRSVTWLKFPGARLVLDKPKESDPEAYASYLSEAENFYSIVLDTLGNPFRPVAVAPEWRTDTAVTLARGVYQSRDFGAMPILADALPDAGCDNANILNHCRDVNQVHVRGCWVVDLVLGKE